MVRVVSKLKIGLLTVLFALPGMSAKAQSVFAEPQQIIDILHAEGYVAKLRDAEKDVNPVILTASQGVNWKIYFYDCDGHVNCKSIQFTAGFSTEGKVSLQQLNAFNADKRLLKVYLDTDDKGVEADLDIIMDGGISRQAFKKNLDSWDYLLGSFLKDIDWK
jgi:hypothetical protein